MATHLLNGIAASPGIAIAKAYVLDKRTLEIPQKNDVEIELEISRFHHAVKQSLIELQLIYEQAQLELGQDKAEIFEGHLFLLQDPDWIDAVIAKIKTDSVHAEYALDQVTKQLVQQFESMKNEYMRERVADIQDVSRRVMAHLLGITQPSASHLQYPVIVIAHDLTPSDTAQLDKQYVVGFATDIGGRTSHSVIIARSLEIPAIVGLKDVSSLINNDEIVIIDGSEGIIIINPSSEQLAQYEDMRKEYETKKGYLVKLVGEQTVTTDGRQVELAANIGIPDDVDGAIRNGAEAIGLFRSEFIYMNRDTLPTEDEQFHAYKKVAEKMKDKAVIIRTLDIGGDKELPYLDLPEEMNPFLGCRAIRLCFDQPEIFKTQLRAILRASHYGKVKIMYPMISLLAEIRQANQFLELAKEELVNENVPFDPNIEVGIMVEIPAAALAADILAKEVDFFSIGTNDLIQYTMACDRMNEKISYLYQPFHPSVLRLAQMVIQAAHEQNKWVGMCGEMAADPIAVPILVGLGLDEFSMSASSILPIRKLIKQLNYEKMKELAEKALQFENQEQILQFVNNEVGKC